MEEAGPVPPGLHPSLIELQLPLQLTVIIPPGDQARDRAQGRGVDPRGPGGCPAVRGDRRKGHQEEAALQVDGPRSLPGEDPLDHGGERLKGSTEIVPCHPNMHDLGRRYPQAIDRSRKELPLAHPRGTNQGEEPSLALPRPTVGILQTLPDHRAGKLG